MNNPPNSVFPWVAANLAEIALALAVAAGIFVLLLALRALLLQTAKRLSPRQPLAGVFVEVIRKTRLWFLAALAIQAVQGYVHPPLDVSRTIVFLFTVAAAFQAAIWTRALILERTIAIWLDADVETLAERVSRRDTRPLLKDKDPLLLLRDLAGARNPIYAQAHIHVRSQAMPHERAVQRIVDALSEWESRK